MQRVLKGQQGAREMLADVTKTLQAALDDANGTGI
jgi:hypothetical protein